VSITREVDAAKEALRGQVPEGALCGLTDALGISYERLQPAERRGCLPNLGPKRYPCESSSRLATHSPRPYELRSWHVLGSPRCQQWTASRLTTND
jgi:hypothetical protein